MCHMYMLYVIIRYMLRVIPGNKSITNSSIVIKARFGCRPDSHRVNQAGLMHHTNMHTRNSDVPPQDFCATLVGVGPQRFRRRGGDRPFFVALLALKHPVTFFHCTGYGPDKLFNDVSEKLVP